MPRAQVKAVPKEIRATFELIRAPLETVEERIRAQAREFSPALEGYVAYACESSGKRLRPALALLAGGATGGIGSPQIELAVILELIHAATLVHDDIMDGADIRRGQPTANAKWGNAISVLLGDSMFAHALKLSTCFTDTAVTRRIADATVEVCSGEIIQTQRRFDLSLSVADYFRIIGMKTGALFGVATELGARLNGTTPEVTEAIALYGLKLGTAYQVYDDCLDIAGNEASAGKTLGSDLRKGKLTLPILYLLERAGDTERARWSEIILSGEGVETLVEAVAREGALRAAVESARDLLREGASALAPLPANPFLKGMGDLCASVDRLLCGFL